MTDYDLKYTGAQIDGLLDAANELKTAGYIYKGVATPSTNPGTPTERVAYLASEPGTYTNFGGIVIASGLYSLTYVSGTWTGTQMQAGSDIEVVQTTGQSTSNVMSQKAVTDELNTLSENMILSESNADFVYNNFLLSTGTTYIPTDLWDVYVYIIDNKYKRLFIESNTAGARIAFLKSIRIPTANGVVGAFATGYSTIYVQDADTKKEYILPSDCRYLMFTKRHTGDTLYPRSAKLFTTAGDRIDNTETEIEKLADEVTITEQVVLQPSQSLPYRIVYDKTWFGYNASANNRHYFIPCTAGQKFKIISNSINCTYIFVKSDNYTAVTSQQKTPEIDYCSEYSDDLIAPFLTANEEVVVVAPNDATGLIVNYLQNGTDFTPAVYRLIPIKEYISSVDDEIKPEDYGAVGDGVADDTNAVQQAFTNGKVVVLENKYKVTNILINHSAYVKGGGTLKAVLNSNGQSKNLIESTTSDIDLTFDNINFDGGGTTPVKTTTPEANLIKIWNAHSVIFKGCKIHNHVNGEEGETYTEVVKRKSFCVSLYNNEFVHIDGCEVYENCEEIFMVGGYKEEDNYIEFGNLQITNCYTHDNENSQALFTVINLSSGLVTNNTFKNNGTSFFNLLSSNFVFVGNLFDTTGKRGIGTERTNWVRMNNIIVVDNIFKNTPDRCIEIGINGCVVANNTIENCIGIDCSGGIRNTQIYHETYGADYVKTICPFVVTCNTLDDEVGLSIHDNILRLKNNGITPQAFIRICGSYDEVSLDSALVRNVNICDNKLYLDDNASLSLAPILIANTYFKDIRIYDNYIDGNDNTPSYGFIRGNLFDGKEMGVLRIKGNVFNDKNGDITYISSFRNGGTYTNIFVEDNISNHSINEVNGTVVGLVTDNNIVIQ